jgi:hypothetical protein
MYQYHPTQIVDPFHLYMRQNNLCFSLSEMSWLLTRDRVPSASTLAMAESVIMANGLDATKYMVTDQSDCPRDG